MHDPAWRVRVGLVSSHEGDSWCSWMAAFAGLNLGPDSHFGLRDCTLDFPYASNPKPFRRTCQ